jgi:hypothetical protein
MLKHVKDPRRISDADRQNSHSFVHSSYFPQMSLLVGLLVSSGRQVSYPQPSSSSSSPWLSMLTCHPGDEQKASWWPQF